MSVSWSDLALEEVALFNAPFIARLLTEGVRGAHSRDDSSLPVALGFLLVPLALHARTRESLPRTVRSSFPAWISSHQELLIGFGDRARGLAPYTREGMLLALTHRTLHLSGSDLVLGEPRRFPRPQTADLAACVKAASFLGRWFTTVGSTASVFALLGVRP